MKYEEPIGQIGGSDITLRALAHDLKNPLIKIAREAELSESADLRDIQRTAEQSLMLIDSYLLSARTEYGQLLLDLEPTTLGAVIHDASGVFNSHPVYKSIGISIEDRTSEPVMTHRQALACIIQSFGHTLLGGKSDWSNSEVVLRGYRSRAGKLGIGIFTSEKISQSDIEAAFYLQGRAHMPLSRFSSQASASLAIADGLCRAIGGEMQVKRMGRLSGLATELPRSEQLAFV